MTGLRPGSGLRYSDHVDILVAAIQYLSRSGPWARTPSFMANELGLDAGQLKTVFDGFPGIFRKSRKPAKHTAGAEHYYSLQARYAQRPDYDKSDRDTKINPLTPEEISTLLDFVLDAVRLEHERKHVSQTNLIAVTAAVVSSISAVIAALFSRGS